LIQRWPAVGLWLGSLAFVVSLVGTQLLGLEYLRLWAVLLLFGAAFLTVLAWGNVRWAPAFRSGIQEPGTRSERIWAAIAISGPAVFICALSHVAYLAVPGATFGAAGWLWLAGIALLLAAAALRSRADPSQNQCAADEKFPWAWWEVVVLGFIALTALVLRLWDLRDVPFNIYPDEIMTGTVAEQAYLNGAHHASVFSTLWGDIQLPALWFAIVAGFLKLGGISLASVRFAPALFGALTVLPLYGFLRNAWGRLVAIVGASIMAFGAVDVHYSRMALNNITTPFFWATCFFFLIRGLRTRRPLDWALAGLAAGLSEHFYYGTRLLPFILVAFIGWLFVVHWREMRHLLVQVYWLVLGYFAGFGPLLSYFATHRGLYYGRGASLMTWNHIPASWSDVHQMWHTLWPIMSANLLGISTHSSQDIMYYAPLLLKPEAALLVLGTALLVWRWRHPAAFLVLLSGLGVLFVGGTLVTYPNSFPPLLAHWTPAFPAFYAAIAIPFGAWMESWDSSVSHRPKWIGAAVVAIGLLLLAWANIDFYFRRYYADPATLRSKHYAASQTRYEEQTVQSRFMASLGPGYRVIVVGKSPYPYDADTTRYLVQGQQYIPAADPQNAGLPGEQTGNGIAFLFFPSNERYRAGIRERFPGGTDADVRNPAGRHLFYAYIVSRKASSKNSRSP
jgi:4-amino-4-deoxy-L-arabinose transferase-like glycosyltransferase